MQELNQPRWKRKPGKTPDRFYEVWYFKLNIPEQQAALWLRLTTLCTTSGTRQLAETWGVFFQRKPDGTNHVAVKETFAVDEFSASNRQVRIKDCFWKDGHTAGAISSNGNSIRWELHFEPNQTGFNHVPKLFSALKLNKATVVTPNPDLRFSGKIWINGHGLHCEAAPGMQGHIYGKQNALSWAWAHCNSADDGKPFVFEALTARILLGGFLKSPPLSAFFFVYDGKRYEFNTVRDALRIKSQFNLEGWQFETVRGPLQFKGSITTRPNDFAGVRYEDTDASRLYCHNSKISTLDLSILRNGKVERTIHSSNACAFEWVTRAQDPRVPFLI